MVSKLQQNLVQTIRKEVPTLLSAFWTLPVSLEVLFWLEPESPSYSFIAYHSIGSKKAVNLFRNLWLHVVAGHAYLDTNGCALQVAATELNRRFHLPLDQFQFVNCYAYRIYHVALYVDMNYKHTCSP
jgi:hypothetical protein